MSTSSPAESLLQSPKRPRVSYTNRSRLKLALSPIYVLVVLVLALAVAVVSAALCFAQAFRDVVRDGWDELYWRIYRPARYGHVKDML